MRVWELAVRGAPALALAVGVTGAAQAADHGAIGQLFRLRQTATKTTLKIVSKDAAIVLPSADPTSVGGTLDVSIHGVSTTPAETFSLPAAQWKTNGTVQVFKGTVPGVKAIKLKAGLVKITGEPSVLTLADAPHSAGHVVLTIGTDRYCLDFDGGSAAAQTNTTFQLKWGLQLVVGSCPALPTTTTTSSTTTTSTLPPACGNGQLDAGEQCDDGNLVDCDGCDSNCTPSGTCGNLITCAPEQCDGGPNCNASCESTKTCPGQLDNGTAQRLVVVSIDTPQPLAGVRMSLSYPAIQTAIPGNGASSEVESRVFVFPTQGVHAINDLDSDLVVVFANTTAFIGSGPLFSANFDECTDIDTNVCNRLPVVTGCCNNPADPTQFFQKCAGVSPTLTCNGDEDCPGPQSDQSNCTAAGQPFACCTGSGTGTCTPNSFCTGNAAPLACCTGAGAGTCTESYRCTAAGEPDPCCTGNHTGTCTTNQGSCAVLCPANPPVCPNTGFNTDPNLPDGPCTVNGGCPGESVCLTQTQMTACTVSSPTDAQGNFVPGVTCSVTIL